MDGVKACKMMRLFLWFVGWVGESDKTRVPFCNTSMGCSHSFSLFVTVMIGKLLVLVNAIQLAGALIKNIRL